MDNKVLGVIGGVGPLATAYFMETLIKRTAAETDQEHVDMIVLNDCQIPDRTAYILDSAKPNPVTMMARDAKRLEELGCAVIVTPCNTAHYFLSELAAAVSVPIIDMIKETAAELVKSGVKKAGIAATDGTIHTKLFQTAFAERGIEAFVPNERNQQFVMDIIYDCVKAGKPLQLDKFKSVTDEMRINGCDRIILGCTELSVLKKEYSLDDYYVDSLEVLCDRAIEACGKTVKRKD